MKASRSEYLELNGLRHHVRRWGAPDAPTLLLLHGWMDISATFQFVVDQLSREWNILAPDWSGFGLSDWNPSGYSLLQYVHDLDCLLDHYSPHASVPIVAHSMGANVTNIFAAARPHRVSHFINIEGYAPVPGFFKGSLGHTVERWLDHLRKPRDSRPYADFGQLATRLQQSNKRLSPERANFLAEHLGQRRDDGQVYIAADPMVHFFGPISLHRKQLIELWRDMPMPVLCVRGGQSFVSKAFEDEQLDLQERLAALRNGREVLLENGSHNLHHEHPATVAQLIEDFLSDRA